MKKLTAFVLAAIMVLSMFTVISADTQKIEATFIKVGETRDYKDIQSAIDAAKAIDGTVVIDLDEGDYNLTDTIKIEDADGIVIRGNGKAAIRGSRDIPFSAFSKVTDEAVLDRIVEKKGKDAVVSAKLSDLGITDLGSMRAIGFGVAGTDEFADKFGYSTTLTYNDEYLDYAQYPNGTDYLYTASIKTEGSDSEVEYGRMKVVRFTVNDVRFKKWAEAKDMYALGWYVHDWAETLAPATVEADGTIKSVSGYAPIKSDRRVKFFNLLEELDVPGEWYLDYETGVLYLIPPTDIKADDKLTFNSFDKDLVNVKNSKNITFEGVRFAGTRQSGIKAEDCENFVINDCDITNTGNTAVIISSSKKSGIKNSYVHDVGSGAVSVNAGDRATLTAGECFVENCHIEGMMRYKKTYAAGISLGGCGNVASHNEINDSPHFAITYGGNNQIIEYNNIYNVCTDTSDSGAIYTGRDWSTQGNEIRYNYFHDLVMIDATTGYEMQAVYLDDTHSSTKVYNNVFYKVDSVALYGGGRYNTFENNIILECKKPFVMDARGETWQQPWLVPSDPSSTYTKLKAFDYKNGVWAEQYPYLVDILEDEPLVPKYNVIKNNAEYRSQGFDLHNDVVKYGTVENNIELSGTSSFENYSGKDFTVKEGSEIYTKIPDFTEIPFNEIGRYEYTVEDNYIEKGTAPAPSDDTIKVIVNDKPVEFDVAPTIINDRTMVPLRAIFEALGADVDWDDATKTITAVKDDTTIKMQIGNDKMTKNGTESTLDSAPVIIDSRTLVPVRAIAESFGSDVSWEAETKTVIVKDLPKEEVKDEEKDATEEEVKADDEKTADDKTEEVTDEKATDETADDKTADETTDETETKPEK